MIKNGLLDCFVGLLKNKDEKTIQVAIGGIQNILISGQSFAEKNNLPANPFLNNLDEINGVKEISRLLFFREEISVVASSVLELCKK